MRKRILLLAGVDIAFIILSISFAYLLRFQSAVPDMYVQQMLWYIPIAIVFCLASMYVFKLYHRMWRYASTGELIAMVKSVLIGNVLTYAAVFLITGHRIPVWVALYAFQSSLILMGGARFAWRVYTDRFRNRTEVEQRVLIIGAGDCGVLIAKEMLGAPVSETMKKPVAFIDDDPTKQHQRILDIPVVGGRKEIVDTCNEKDIDVIVLAIPSVTKETQRELIDICNQTKAKVQIIPPIQDLLNGKVTLNHIRDVRVEDLLGREPVKVDLHGIADYLSGKTVLVTGAGGSIGSELCRQISMFKPKSLLLLGHGENSIYMIHKELQRVSPELNITPLIVDVQDGKRINQIFRMFRPQVVFHAAAHKHVPLMESNPMAAIKNNVFGTKNTADSADRYGAEQFILISTDKAVNPTSVMGTTKRVAEMIIQTMNRKSKTRFAAVRFGNVLGSRGSVIPHFKEQIAYGGPVTVTHPDMVRYFMTIPEASQLVVQAGALAQGGEIFVLDMGEPVKILKLAEDVIRLSGLEPYKDIPIKFTGIRPGEKLYEELLLDGEGDGQGVQKTSHHRIFIGQPLDIDEPKLALELRRLEMLLQDDKSEEVPSTLKDIVPNFVGVG